MSGREPLALRGTTRSLSTLVRGGDETLSFPLELTGEAALEERPAWAIYRPRAGGLGEIRFDLPAKTPPGSYEATVALPDGDQRVILEVEPQPHLRFHPRGGIVVTGGANERVTTTVTALNEGNGSIEIPKSGGVGLYEQNAIGCALGRTLRAGVKKGEDLVHRIAEEVAAEFGGTMRLNVSSGGGVLEADAVRELTLVLHCPDGLERGKTYAGEWAFAGGGLTITIHPNKKQKGTKT